MIRKDRRIALTRLGMAHRETPRRPFLRLTDAPDSWREDWVAAGIAFVALLLICIVASGSVR